MQVMKCWYVTYSKIKQLNSSLLLYVLVFINLFSIKIWQHKWVKTYCEFLHRGYKSRINVQIHLSVWFCTHCVEFCKNSCHYLNVSTCSHKNMYLCALSVWHCFMYLTAHFAAVSKRNVHWVALKHRLNTWTLAHFYYVDVGTYCCVFITLLQKCIAAAEFKYLGSVH